MLFEDRLQKIQEKKKRQSIDDLIMCIASWYSFVPSKNDGLISIFPKTQRTPPTVTSTKFESARDNLTTEGIEYNKTTGFFKNFQSLFSATPQPNLSHFSENENSDFSHCVLGSKNVYLGFTIIEDVENCLYSFTIKTGSRNILNSLLVWEHSDNVFSSKGVMQSYNIFYSKYIFNSSNIWFSENLVGCEECLFCHDLNNQRYCIYNKVYTQEMYLVEKEKYLHQKQNFDTRFSQLGNKGMVLGSNNVTGNFIVHSENISSGYGVFDIKDGKNIIFVGGHTTGERIFDTMLITPPFEDAYGVMSSGTGCSQIYNSIHIIGGSYIFYSQLLTGCSYCFGCVGLQNKQFCILNKQYTKEARFIKVNQIFAQMDSEGVLGDFFPGWMNPFYFNDTAAYLMNPSFTKEEVTKLGYMRRDEPIKVDVSADAEVVKVDELGKYEGFDEDGNWIINPHILKRIILDNDGNYYRIVQMEYDFLVKYGLPLPRKHWLERLKQHFDLGLGKGH